MLNVLLWKGHSSVVRCRLLPDRRWRLLELALEQVQEGSHQSYLQRLPTTVSQAFPEDPIIASNSSPIAGRPPMPVILFSLADPPALILASLRSLRKRACSAARDAAASLALDTPSVMAAAKVRKLSLEEDCG